MEMNPLEVALASKDDELLEKYLMETDTDDVREDVAAIAKYAAEHAAADARRMELTYQVERLTHDRAHIRHPAPKTEPVEETPVPDEPAPTTGS